MTQATATRVKKETMNVIDVVLWCNKRGLRNTTLLLMSASGNRNVCDIDGNMTTQFIRKMLTCFEDTILFRELQCEVTTTLW